MSRRTRIPGTYTTPRTLYILPAIPDDLEPHQKNALATRNACATEGRCPCCHVVGFIHPDTIEPLLLHLVFEHEPWCEVVAA